MCRKLQFDAFLRAFALSKTQSFGFLFGAGCSVSSGVPAASRCIWDWKRMLYISNNPTNTSISIDSESDKKEIQRWCNLQPGYPKQGDPSEYVFYVEEAMPQEDIRRNYFESLFEGKSPSVGYCLLPLLHQKGVLKSVWTTNFDRLTVTSFTQANQLVHEVAIDDKDRIFEALSRSRFNHIALHGDYRYSKLKNTEAELYSQESLFVEAMSSYFVDKHLIVMGYSGRDASLMSALEIVFAKRGSGVLYWLGMDPEPTNGIAQLLNIATQNGRQAFYIQSPVFDEIVSRMAKVAYNDDEQALREVNEIESKSCSSFDSKVPFVLNPNINAASSYAETNLYPIVIPKECFCFELTSSKANLWGEVRDNIRGKAISAIVYQGKVYALGSYDEIYNTFKNSLKNTLQPLPLSVMSCEEIPVFRRLIINGVLIGIADLLNLNIEFRKDLLWNPQRIYNNKQGIYKALKLSLKISNIHGVKQMFLSLNPTLFFEEGQCNVEFKKIFLKSFSDTLRNEGWSSELQKWHQLLFANGALSFGLPLSNTASIFKISPNAAYCYIVNGNKPIQSPIGFNQRRLYFGGIDIVEPALLFSNGNRLVRDANPMRGLTNNAPYDIPSKVLEPEAINIGVICPKCLVPNAERFLRSLVVGGIEAYGRDYFQTYRGFNIEYHTTLNVPTSKDEGWITCKDSQTNPKVLADNICRSLEKVSSVSPNTIVAIFIPNHWTNIKTFKIGEKTIDFHDYIKSFAAQSNIPTQIIEEKTLSSSLSCAKHWWVSLAIFVKSGRVPWTMADLDQNSAYAGIGYAIDTVQQKGKQIVIGCSHLYNCHGQGLKFRLQKIDDNQLNFRKNPYLTEQDAYNFGLNIIEMFRQAMTNMPKRVVIHKKTIFKPSEIAGLVKALSPHISDIDLITIEEEKSIKLISKDSKHDWFDTSKYPVHRGLCFRISDFEAMLWTHGTVPSIESGRSYFVGAKGIPKPLKITRCYGKSSLEQIASEILSFTKLNWNSFEYHTKMPSTIDTSNNAARIGVLLQHYNGHCFDSRFFM